MVHASFIFAVVAALVVLVTLVMVYVRKARSSATQTWSTILGKLQSVNRQKLRIAAEGLTSEGKVLNPADVVDLVGGLDGLTQLEHNCEVLVEAACFVQRWHPEALVVAENIRFEARKLQWHVERLRLAQTKGHRAVDYPEYMQGAADIYTRVLWHIETIDRFISPRERELLRAAI